MGIRGREGGGGRRGCTHVMHGGSRMTVAPSHPHTAGKEHVEYSPNGRALLAPSAKRREVFGESHEESCQR